MNTTTNTTTRNRKRMAMSATIAAAVGLSLVGVGPVEAKGGDAKIVRGSCVGTPSVWKLKGKADSGNVLEIEFEVDTPYIGNGWKVTITDNGRTVYSGNRTTLAPSGSFSVERRIPTLAGTDKIVAKATRNGRTCTGTLSL